MHNQKGTSQYQQISDVMFQNKARFGNESLKILTNIHCRTKTSSLSLEVILTDLATIYHSHTSRPPCEVD